MVPLDFTRTNTERVTVCRNSSCVDGELPIAPDVVGVGTGGSHEAVSITTWNRDPIDELEVAFLADPAATLAVGDTYSVEVRDAGTILVEHTRLATGYTTRDVCGQACQLAQLAP